MQNTTYINGNGFTVTEVSAMPIRAYAAQGHIERLERNDIAYTLYVCGFSDETRNFRRFNLSATPHVTLFNNEREAKAYCEGTVIHYDELLCVSEDVVNQYVQANQRSQENHRKNLMQ